jgi:hypothetical protein
MASTRAGGQSELHMWHARRACLYVSGLRYPALFCSMHGYGPKAPNGIDHDGSFPLYKRSDISCSAL